MLCKIASASKSKTHVDRNLRRCIFKAGATLPIELVLVPTTIMLRKPKLLRREVFWPCFSMASWIQVLANTFPRFVFGGFKPDQETEWRTLFTWFWKTYRQFDSEHPLYESNLDPSICVPYMTHGDEGRGLRSQAFMVESFQFVISYLGPYTTNTSGYLGLGVSLVLCAMLSLANTF